MNLVEKFMEYNAAWEDAYATDDWTKIEPFFTEDAVYEVIADPPFNSRTEGRDAVREYFKRVSDTFDRRFGARIPHILEGPLVRDGVVWMRWLMVYPNEGTPDLHMLGEETAVFAGDRIQRLEDRILKFGVPEPESTPA